MRGFLVASALWLGLLGAVEPVFSCAMSTPAPDCCPSGPQGPCDHDPAPADVLTAPQLCCTSAPMGVPLAASIQKSDPKSSQGAPGAADPPLIAAAQGALSSASADPGRLRFASSASERGTSTYLRTGRLRL